MFETIIHNISFDILVAYFDAAMDKNNEFQNSTLFNTLFMSNISNCQMFEHSEDIVEALGYGFYIIWRTNSDMKQYRLLV